MWTLIILLWLALQLPIAFALGRFIGCPRKSAKPAAPRRYPTGDTAHAA